MSTRCLTTIAVCVLLASVAWAQTAPPPTGVPQYTPGETMPTSMFYWLLGIGSAIVGSLVTVINVLWGRLNNPPIGCIFSKESQTSLQEIAAGMKTGLEQVKAAQDRWVVERSELRGELDKWQERYLRQQAKMDKLAVRTQRAVEAVAGLEPPAVESDMDDTDHDGK